jgi:hypothetical protein
MQPIAKPNAYRIYGMATADITVYREVCVPAGPQRLHGKVSAINDFLFQKRNPNFAILF